MTGHRPVATELFRANEKLILQIRQNASSSPLRFAFLHEIVGLA
jgi:hypothetical protein